MSDWKYPPLLVGAYELRQLQSSPIGVRIDVFCISLRMRGIYLLTANGWELTWGGGVPTHIGPYLNCVFPWCVPPTLFRMSAIRVMQNVYDVGYRGDILHIKYNYPMCTEEITLFRTDGIFVTVRKLQSYSSMKLTGWTPEEYEKLRVMSTFFDAAIHYVLFD